MLVSKNYIVLAILVVFCSSCQPQPKTKPLQPGVTFVEINTDPDLVYYNLEWSPDGNYMVVRTQGTATNNEILNIIDLTDQTYHPLKTYPDRNIGNAYGASWSPDSRRLVLAYPVRSVQERPDQLHLDIAIMTAETGTLYLPVSEGAHATWGRNQNEVIVIDHARGGGDAPLSLINMETGVKRNLGMANPGSAKVLEMFDVSSTGLLLYPDNTGFHIIDIATQDKVGQFKTSMYSPRWSPDGQMVAFLNNTEDVVHSSLYLATFDASCFSSSPSSVIDATSIDWSPDGNKIAFSNRHERGKIFFLDLTEGIGKELMDTFQEKCVQ